MSSGSRTTPRLRKAPHLVELPVITAGQASVVQHAGVEAHKVPARRDNRAAVDQSHIAESLTPRARGTGGGVKTTAPHTAARRLLATPHSLKYQTPSVAFPRDRTAPSTHTRRARARCSGRGDLVSDARHASSPATKTNAQPARPSLPQSLLCERERARAREGGYLPQGRAGQARRDRPSAITCIAWDRIEGSSSLHMAISTRRGRCLRAADWPNKQYLPRHVTPSSRISAAMSLGTCVDHCTEGHHHRDDRTCQGARVLWTMQSSHQAPSESQVQSGQVNRRRWRTEDGG